jgi:aminoglycoside phosphotransferase family enzyme
MVRMPKERMMPRLIERGELAASHIDALVEVLSHFYQRAEGGADIAAFGTATAVAVNVLENFDQTREFIDQGALTRGQYDRISQYAHNFLAREALFEERRAGAFIRDCHGDLYSANICLADKVYIFDCIEFNQRFRYCDVASDVAFLAMDLDFHGLEQLSKYFIGQFCRRSDDPGLPAVLDFYKSYRAYVRGKIGLFTAGDPKIDPRVREVSLQQAARYFQLADRYVSL